MNRKLSQRLLLAEAIVLVLPLTGLLGIFVSMLSISVNREFWPWVANDLVTVLAATAVVAGWWLIFKAIYGGAEALRHANRSWWFAASLGPVLVFAAIASRLSPPSPEYSEAQLFREHLQLFSLGAPLVLVLIHLWAEARFRNQMVEDSRH